ncbi:MAG: (deoxy)nucleoside triphosphate pyrophosphohydrolase [Candidatus Marinimicrobia bacterium]|nr:(deoxy)nucleoside triphosphate pyrophosphohydrolase [Candidatus Neomarinimicrobiota bacterium]
MQKVVAAVIEIDGFFLLCRRHKRSARFPLKWEFPGGKLEKNETPAEALSRELKEELGIEIKNSEPLTDYRYRYNNEPEIHLYFFRIRDFEKTVQNRQFDMIAWVALNDLHRYDILDGDRKLLNILQNRTDISRG